MLKRLMQRLKGEPNFYQEVRPNQIERYQHYVSMALKQLDVENNTKWSRGDKNYDRDRLSVDDKVMEELIVGGAATEGLSPAYLQIMINQYFFADPYLREKDAKGWVRRVLDRKSVDYFPDPWALRKTLESAR